MYTGRREITLYPNKHSGGITRQEIEASQDHRKARGDERERVKGLGSVCWIVVPHRNVYHRNNFRIPELTQPSHTYTHRKNALTAGPWYGLLEFYQVALP